MRVRTILAFAVSVAFAVAAQAQLRGKWDSGCITTAEPIKATGKLIVRRFAGPPDYASIRDGDEDDLVLILKLPVSVCIHDADFDTLNKRFETVQVWTSDGRLRSKLHRLVGRTVTVTGDGYAAHAAHHRAPLVLEAKSARAG